jgi:UBX domain-containing protein 6
MSETSQEKNVQCPVCQKWWNSETEVSAHLEECLATSLSSCMDGSDGGRGDHGSNGGKEDHSIDGGGRECSSGGGRGGYNDDGSDKSMQDLGEAVRILLLGGPSNATLGVFVRLLRNILGDSKAEKFRRVRLANPKIRETVGMALGGVEFLESVGFHLIADGEEVVAVMDDTSETQLGRIKQALVLLEPHYVSGSLPSTTASQLSSQPSVPANRLELQKVDRQV